MSVLHCLMTGEVCAKRNAGGPECRCDACSTWLQSPEPALLDALQECQRLLADLARPDAKACPLEIANTWARCVAAEAKARAALAAARNKDKSDDE